MNLQELQNLDPQRIGSWPAPIRMLVMIAICAAVLGAGFYLDTQNQRTELESVQGRENELRETFQVKQRKAANLDPLKEQMKKIEREFGELLRLLPNKTEIEGLLVLISQAGLGSGLEFELFKPSAEQPQEFYAIQPIEIAVTGNYHEFGNFISQVAALDRVVTSHEINIEPINKGVKGAPAEGATELRMKMVAKTYRYLEDEEIEALEEEAKGKKGRRR